jgi:hypothetical protein
MVVEDGRFENGDNVGDTIARVDNNTAAKTCDKTSVFHLLVLVTQIKKTLKPALP